jgi:hypothetical protein
MSMVRGLSVPVLAALPITVDCHWGWLSQVTDGESNETWGWTW